MKKLTAIAGVLATFLLSSLTVLAQTPPSRKDQQKDAKARLAELQNKSLVPSAEERLRYADFLKSEYTGLIRLLPREKYDTHELSDINRGPVAPASFARQTLDDFRTPTPLTSDAGDVPRVNTASPAAKSPVVGEKSGDVRGGGAYYSFTQGTHEYGYATDLSLERGYFQTGFYGANYGFLANLGDVPLQSIQLDTLSVKPLATYKPAVYDAGARLEQRRFGEGVDIGGIRVKSRLPMQLNSTYLLRAVNYDESDVLVAFKVVDIDADGSPLLLWKLLKRYSTPKYQRN